MPEQCSLNRNEHASHQEILLKCRFRFSRPELCIPNKLPGEVACWSWTGCQTAVNTRQHASPNAVLAGSPATVFTKLRKQSLDFFTQRRFMILARDIYRSANRESSRSAGKSCPGSSERLTNGREISSVLTGAPEW